MSQYSMPPALAGPSTYREWPVSEPTSRREDLWTMPPKEAESHDFAGQHLALIADSHGDNCIMVATGSLDEYEAIQASPGVKRRAELWRSNSPRYGSWGWYLLDVALVRYVFEFAGWTPTAEEERLMDALEEYGQRAPAYLVRAV